ncbi:MAG: Unknown protein [uncultured Sulfurovum sp.]|uniref:Restriction endonuclease n=1 Tax=uncultured Sulfurovum sp. TaxID=269237 RepID=A0A6S6U9A8_9BACT|nr:MAG: Unknown protein [uncultured Sulfurovum sp.]
MINNIENYFNSFDFDIRKTHSNRFMDQKVTPDVLCMVADCVHEYLDTHEHATREFTSKDIWHFEYSNKNVKDVFGKPDVLDKNAISEYNKFFHQPLKMLSYAQVLTENKKNGKGNTLYFTLKNKDLLEYLSIKEKNCLDFINIYLEKILRDSNVWYLFQDFFIVNTNDKFYTLKNKYIEFIQNNTATNDKKDISRIFTKVINPLSFKRKKHGTKGGYFSKDIIGRDELMYNRRNWRDIKKKREETREEYELRAKKEVEYRKKAYVKYTLNKATNIVRKLHTPISEVDDNLAVGEATQVHHIFMKSQYPQIESYIENLILLTATQHNTKAHPSNNTRIIDKEYQLICLLAKSKTIEKHIHIYSKEDFLYVIKIGLGHEFENDIKFKQLQSKLIELYND